MTLIRYHSPCAICEHKFVVLNIHINCHYVGTYAMTRCLAVCVCVCNIPFHFLSSLLFSTPPISSQYQKGHAPWTHITAFDMIQVLHIIIVYTLPDSRPTCVLNLIIQLQPFQKYGSCPPKFKWFA